MAERTTRAPRIDTLTGTATTGHEWDGIHELNTPLPRWWLWTFYLTIIWAIGYWVVYPAWPLLTSATQGRLGWHSRSAVVADLERAQAAARADDGQARPTRRSRTSRTIRSCSISPARTGARPSPTIARLATAPAAAAARAIPISTTTTGCGAASSPTSSRPIRHGARSGDDEGHQGNMPAFGRDGMLKAERDFGGGRFRPLAVRASGGEGRRSRARQEGVRRQLRRSVMGRKARAIANLGAPNLTDKIWLYGSDKETIVQGIAKRPRRRDAGLAGPAERADHQGAGRLRLQLRRRREVIVQAVRTLSLDQAPTAPRSRDW